jgi:beta-lactam-binding protein with PASTA domain
MKTTITLFITLMLAMMLSCVKQVKEPEVRVRDADMASQILEMSENIAQIKNRGENNEE